MSSAIEAELRVREDKAAIDRALADLGAKPGKKSTREDAGASFNFALLAILEIKKKTRDVCGGVLFSNQVHEH